MPSISGSRRGAKKNLWVVREEESVGERLTQVVSRTVTIDARPPVRLYEAEAATRVAANQGHGKG